MKLESEALYFVPGWKKIPFLVHGFGSRHWKLYDLETHRGLKNFDLLFLNQIHSDILHIIEDVPEERLGGDALLTGRQGILLVIETADCLPVLIVDREKKAVAAVHCGWRSTSQRLAQKVVKCLKEHFHCKPSSLLVAFGPCIGKDCYVVGEDVRKKFKEEELRQDVFLPHPLHAGKFYLDLSMAIKHQLKDEGVKDSNIFMVNLCTHCEPDLLSYRRSQQTEGRMLSFIGMTSA